MSKAKTLVGLDVPATKIVAAVLDAETGRVAPLSRQRRRSLMRATAATRVG
jgi:hypothetical protein